MAIDIADRHWILLMSRLCLQIWDLVNITAVTVGIAYRYWTLLISRLCLQVSDLINVTAVLTGTESC